MIAGKVVIGVWLFVLMVMMMGYAQPPEIEWMHEYVGGWACGGNSVQQTMDGGYIFAGAWGADPLLECDVLLVKVDDLGYMEWHREIGMEYTADIGYSVQTTSDGGYIIAAQGRAAHSPMDLVKTDNQGYQLWTRYYGGPDGMGARDVRQTSDGGYIVVGTTSSFGAGLCDYFLVKTNGHGDTTWTRTYGGIEHDHATCVRLTEDGGYIIAGTTRVIEPYIYDLFVVKTNAAGDTLWTRTYGGTENESVNSIQQTSDGGYVMVGSSTSFGAGSCNIFLIRTDSEGDTLWTRCYGGEPWRYAYSILQTSDGGYFLGGAISPFGTHYGAYFMRTDDRGDTLWTLTYYEEYSSNGISEVQLTDDQGYIAVGAAYSDIGSWAWLVKIAPDTFTYAPEIQVSDTLLDFLGVVVGDDSARGITLYNAGNTQLIIYSVTTGDSSFFTDFNPSDSLLAPGDSVIITVTFAPQDTISYDDTLTIDNNDELVMVALHGIGVPPGAVSSEPSSNPPTAFALTPAYPNPFNATTSIGYDIPVRGVISLEVYDVLGRMVAGLVNGLEEAGRYQVVWDAADLPSGIYFVRMQAGELVRTGKMVLLK